jgi:hypothetical protein
MGSIPVSLNLVRLPMDSPSVVGLKCHKCDQQLELHQPDENLADRFGFAASGLYRL